MVSDIVGNWLNTIFREVADGVCPVVARISLLARSLPFRRLLGLLFAERPTIHPFGQFLEASGIQDTE